MSRTAAARRPSDKRGVSGHLEPAEMPRQATARRAASRAAAPSPGARARRLAALAAIHRDIEAFQPAGFGPPVHGPAIDTRLFLIGQAPGPHEARFGRPFAWTAGKTLFRWLESATGTGEERIRERIYISAVVRCFPGKAPGGGDRLPSPEECALWRGFVQREVALLAPRLVIPVGRLAIAEVLGGEAPLATVVGRLHRRRYHGVNVDVLPLPHPSGASTWFKMEPGRTLLAQALELLRRHPEVRRNFAPRAARAPTPRAGGARG